MRRQNRRGYTLVDVTVAMAVFVVLFTILVPGCFMGGGGRQPARRSQCKNNLKQLGLALHNYHDVNNTLPPGWIAVRPESGQVPSGVGAFGWNEQILPYFDQAPLFQKFDHNDPTGPASAANAKFTATILRATSCPTDVGPEQAGSAITKLGTTNYVGNFGVGEPTVYSPLDPATGNPARHHGVFGQNSKVRFRDMKDGSSNVVLVGERRLPKTCSDWPVGKLEGSFASYWSGISDIRTVSPLAIVGTVSSGSIADTTQLNPSGPLLGTGTDQVPGTLTLFGINRLVDGTTMDEDTKVVTAGFSSYHTGGCQMLLGDGTVRFINEKIDRQVLINLFRRADGQTLGEF